jgi:hypothetical protein
MATYLSRRILAGFVLTAALVAATHGDEALEQRASWQQPTRGRSSKRSTPGWPTRTWMN